MRKMPRQEQAMPGKKEMEQYAPKLSQVFTEIGDFRREEQIPIAIAILGFQQSSEQIIALFEKHEERGDFVFFDTSGAFPENMWEEEYILYCGDNHTNDRANRVFADALYGFLTEKKLVPTS